MTVWCILLLLVVMAVAACNVYLVTYYFTLQDNLEVLTTAHRKCVDDGAIAEAAAEARAAYYALPPGAPGISTHKAERLELDILDFVDPAIAERARRDPEFYRSLRS